MGSADLPGHLRRPQPDPGVAVDVLHDRPEGEKHAGFWDITETNEPKDFSFNDGFADLEFNPDPDLPVGRNVYSFTEHDGGTRATYVSTYATAEGLQQVLDMGMVEGATSAINQIDELVAAG